LVAAKQSAPETCNCHGERDFHLWLAIDSDADKPDAVVIEVTPRLRRKHKAWQLKNLQRFVTSGARVRISGWILCDEEHPNEVGKSRATIWEIHPITKIEVKSAGKWREL